MHSFLAHNQNICTCLSKHRLNKRIWNIESSRMKLAIDVDATLPNFLPSRVSVCHLRSSFHHNRLKLKLHWTVSGSKDNKIDIYINRTLFERISGRINQTRARGEGESWREWKKWMESTSKRNLINKLNEKEFSRVFLKKLFFISEKGRTSEEMA